MIQHKTCYTCKHGCLKNQAPQNAPPVMRNWCEKHAIWWQELCSDYTESQDLIDLPGRGDSINP